MTDYWFVWPTGIAIWLALGWAAFAYFEAHALRHDARKDQITLSMFCYTIGSKFPLSILLAGLFIGLFIGALGVHFLWHWCPPGSISTGSLTIDQLRAATGGVSISFAPPATFP